MDLVCFTIVTHDRILTFVEELFEHAAQAIKTVHGVYRRGAYFRLRHYLCIGSTGSELREQRRRGWRRTKCFTDTRQSGRDFRNCVEIWQGKQRKLRRFAWHAFKSFCVLIRDYFSFVMA
jgi:hypothetical protein